MRLVEIPQTGILRISGHISFNYNKALALKYNSTPNGLVWYTNRADFSFFWH